MCTDYEIAREVEKRICNHIWQKKVLCKTILCSTIAICCILFMGVATHMYGNGTIYVVEESPYASLVFAGSSAGGYVLVGILALVLGVVITMVCLYTTQKSRENTRWQEEGELRNEEE